METGAVEQGRGPDALLSLEDVLETLKTSRSGFAVIRRTADFPPALTLTPGGRRLYFREADVRAWLANRARG